MQFHAIVEYPRGKWGWKNHTRDSLLAKVIVPFVQGQVVAIGKPNYNTVLNMKSCTTLVAYKTPEKIESVGALRSQADSKKYQCTAELLNEAKKQASAVGVASLLQKALEEPINQIFVIMKFRDKHLDSAYETAIRPAIESFGFRCVRIDEVQDSGRITDQILESIAKSRAVLADLTGGRPNCYYEAGFSHALGKEMILTIRSSETIHFDLSGYRFIEWETDADFKRKLTQRLHAMTDEESGRG